MLTKNFKLDPKKSYSVPNELLVILTADGNRQVTRSIPHGPMRRIAAGIPKTFGFNELDSQLSKLNCSSVCKIHSPVPESSKLQGTLQQQNAEAIEATYRLRFDDPQFDQAKAIKQLSGIKGVKAVVPNHLRFSQLIPNDSLYSSQWALPKINCPAAWDMNTGSSTVKVAIVDSGIDLNHPDLVGNLIAGRDFVDLSSFGVSSGDVITLDGDDFRLEGDVLTVDAIPDDEVGHGTHVAGTVGATSNNSTGVTGVAWECSLMPVSMMFRIVRISDGQVQSVGTDADIAAGIRWAADNGARIINLSLGGYDDNPVQRNAIQYAISKNCLVVAAMGNENTSAPLYPAAYPNVFAVGAINQSENRAFFSNTGSHIDVAAPGVNIRSTYWDDTYDFLQGTSMAAPHVAGLAALILACDSSKSASEVADIIRQTCKPLRDNPGDPIPNDQYGYGLIDAEEALKRVCIVVKSPFLDTNPSRDDITISWLDNIGTHPILDQFQTDPFRDQIVTKPLIDEPKTHPILDQIMTNPIRDQIGSIPFLDEPGCHPHKDQIGTLHIHDQVKNPSDDKIPWQDFRQENPTRRSSPAPFALATPHHYAAGQSPSQQYTYASLQEYEAVFQQAAQLQNQLSAVDKDYLNRLYQEYVMLQQTG